LKSHSQPFEDTSYKPEFFLVSPNIKTPIPGNRGFFLQGGFQHESNGRGGDLSRSTNFLYLKPMFIFYDTKSKFGLYAAPKVWAYVANADDTNPGTPPRLRHRQVDGEVMNAKDSQAIPCQ
jgi:phospholipase A1